MVRAAKWATALALLAAGCSRAPAPGPWVEPPAPGGTVVDAIRARTVAAERLQASLELSWLAPDADEPEGCSAFLVFDRTEGLRVLARSVAFVTVFELVADTARVWLDVPREELTVAGALDDPGWNRLPASREAFLVALFADPWAGEGRPGAFRHPDGDRSVLLGDGWTLRLDPETGLPASYQRADLSIRWGDWAVRRGVPWPHRAEIRAGDGTLVARLGRLILGRAGSPGQFDFRPPEGREILRPDEAADRWNSGLEGL